MMMRKTHPVLKIINSSLIDLPSPSNISYWWNMGSLLGVCLGIQLITGVFLAMHYSGDVTLAFQSLSHICRDVNYGWLLRILHANGASLFFILIYMHVGRGLYYSSFNLHMTWLSGSVILVLLMATAFLGYVLPWGQMSFWGATVITNLLSAFPYIGPMITQWLWGGFSVDNATLTRFFSLHFLVPFVLTALILIHLMFLHQTGSSNPLGSPSNMDKIPFHPYFSWKDILGLMIMTTSFCTLTLIDPYLLGDPENFTPANPLATPVHIQPEWYFLFAYAILRSIPNKVGGVIALFMSILVIMTLPFSVTPKFTPLYLLPINKIMFWYFVNIFLLLTWIGARPVEDPFILIGQVLTLAYFSFFLALPLFNLKQSWPFN